MSSRHLDDEHIAGLVALCRACNGSIYAHQPLPFIRKKFDELYRNEAKKIIEKLIARGYVNPHKGRNISYSITPAGIEKIKELQELGMIPRII